MQDFDRLNRIAKRLQERYSDEIIVVATFFDVSHNSLLKK